MEFIEKYLPINTPEKVTILIHDIINSGTLPFPRHELINQISFHIRKKKLQEMFRADITQFSNTNVDIRLMPDKKTGMQNKFSSKVSNLNSVSKREKADAKSSAERHKAIIGKKSNIDKKRNKVRKDNILQSKPNNITTSLTSKEVRRHSHRNWKYRDNNVTFVSPHNVVGKNLKEIANELNLSVFVLQNIFTSNKVSLTKSYSMKDFNIVKDEINSLVSPSVYQRLAGNPNTCVSILRQNQRFSSS
jgi:hypothetical protein